MHRKTPSLWKDRQNTLGTRPQMQHEQTACMDPLEMNEAAASASIQGSSLKSGPKSALC